MHGRVFKMGEYNLLILLKFLKLQFTFISLQINIDNIIKKWSSYYLIQINNRLKYFHFMCF